MKLTLCLSISDQEITNHSIAERGPNLQMDVVIYRRLRTRRALTLLNHVPFRTRRVLSLYKVYGDSVVLVLNRIPLDSINAFLVLS